MFKEWLMIIPVKSVSIDDYHHFQYKVEKATIWSKGHSPDW